MDHRNYLALERTRLANERTFLAYVRTSLSMLAAGVILLEFFSIKHAYEFIAYLLISTGLLVLIIGAYRVYSVKKRLNKLP